MNFSKEKLFTKDIPIAVCKNHSYLSEMQAAHTHDFIEITYVLQGSCVQKIDKVEYVAKEGDLLFITLDQVHSFRVRENSKMRYFNVLIDPSLINRSIISSESSFETRLLTTFEDILKINTVNRFLSFDGDERVKVENILNEMVLEYQSPVQQNDSVLVGYLMVLFAYMHRKYFHESEKKPLLSPKIIQYIDEHFTENLTLTEVSQKGLYSPKYFSRLFKARFGISLTEYIRRKRIDMGKSLLLETEFRVDTVSEMVGYSNTAHFHRYFKKLCGVTPNEYRKKYRSGNGNSGNGKT